MKKTLIITNIVSLGIILLLLKDCGKKPETKTITITKEIVIPEVTHTFDTLREIKYVNKYIDNTTDSLVNLFLIDSINRLNMFLSAVSIREYNTEFIDSNQEISVYTKTRGELLEQSTKYTIFERKVTFDTTINCVTYPKNKFYGSIGARFGNGQYAAVVGANIITKKNKIIGVDFSTNKQATISYGIKF